MQLYIISLLIIMTIVQIFIILVYISNNLLKVKKYTLYSSKLPDEFDNFKLLHITDVHSKIFGKNNEKVINTIKKINPEIIIMSGDIIDQRTGKVNDFICMYEEIYKSFPTFYSIGNHERKLKYKLYKSYIENLKKLGVHVLINDSEKYFKNGQYIVINSLKFRENMQPKVITEERKEKYIKYMKNALPNIDTNDFNILIVHDAENFELYEKLKVDLVFSGHIHGGVIRFGKIGLLSPRRKLFPKYSYGINKINNTIMETSSGMGKASFPIRLFNRPEIVQVILKKKK